jgi:phage tail-like protein
MTTLDPILSNYFLVEIDGAAIAQFKACDGLSVSVNVVEHRVNHIVSVPDVKKMPGLVKYENIVLKYGVVADPTIWKWIKQVQSGGIASARKNGSITVFKLDGGVSMKWNFYEGWPCHVEVGNLSATSDSVLLETVHIAHEKLELAS